MNALEELTVYLERRLRYSREDLELGLIPGVQDILALDRLEVRIEELRITLNFIKNLEHMYPSQCTPASSE